MTEREKGNFRAVVAGREMLSSSSCLVTFERPEGFPDALPGQFVSIRVTSTTVPLLRRPYSVMDLTEKELVFLVKAVGTGSKILCSAEGGEILDIAGPLGGRTFDDPGGEDAVFVAGGTGLAPMIYAVREWKRRGLVGKAHLAYGASTAGELLEDLCTKDFDAFYGATVDGSKGFCGDVVSLLENLLDGGKIPVARLYSCGPGGMVRAVVEKLAGRFKSHQTSLEAVMACGVGACRGCTVPVKEGEGTVLKAVCSDGTVFEAEEVAWEEWI